jgi:hypothetical protein
LGVNELAVIVGQRLAGLVVSRSAQWVPEVSGKACSRR